MLPGGRHQESFIKGWIIEYILSNITWQLDASYMPNATRKDLPDVVLDTMYITKVKYTYKTHFIV